MGTKVIGIGGISLQVSLPDRSAALEESYLPFGISSAAPAGIWRVRAGCTGGALNAPPDTPAAGGTWGVTRRDGRKIFSLFWKRGDLFLWKKAIMEADCSRGEIWAEQRGREAVSFPPVSYTHLTLPTN